MTKRLTKKSLLSLRLPSKCSFTSSKLCFFGLRKPKNSSFYPNLNNKMMTRFAFGSPSCRLEDSLLPSVGKPPPPLK